jgi:hypothetical protein
MTDTIPAFKGFNTDLTCRGFQFVEGETFEQDAPAELCTTGFHAVTSPLEVFSYYPPATSVYHEVTLEGVDAKRESDSKIAGRKITIGAAIGIPGLVKAHIKFVMDNVSKDAPKGAVLTGDRSAASNSGDGSAASNSGDYSAASNSGDYSAASNSGDYSAASNSGDRSAASNSGDQSAASNSGNYSAASNSGNGSAASNSGNGSAASNSGDQSAASNSGNYSAASNSGNYSAASVTGKESIAIVTGKNSKASGALGCWIILTERDNKRAIVGVKAVKVDGKKVKADTFYMLVDGKVQVSA